MRTNRIQNHSEQKSFRICFAKESGSITRVWQKFKCDQGSGKLYSINKERLQFCSD